MTLNPQARHGAEARMLVRYGRFNRGGKFHIPADDTCRTTLCARTDQGLTHCTLAPEHRDLAEREEWVCKACIRATEAKS